ncbi:MAG: EF-hand domain-containing protein [Pseudomonadota bacterium]
MKTFLCATALFAGLAFAAGAQAQDAGQIDAAFSQLDANGDGAVDLPEMRMMAGGDSAADPRLTLMIVMLDADGSGTLSRQEFGVMMTSGQGQITEEQSRRLFDYFDSDGSGDINRSEARASMQQMGSGMSEADMDAAMEAADSNGDGAISFDEFLRQQG